MFVRLVAVSERLVSLESAFEYELTQQPMSLFTKGMMRKGDKSVLFKAFMQDDSLISTGEVNIYNDSIIDGEYIFMPKHNKFLFASFDLLYYGSEDVRSESVLQNRLNKLNDVLKVCFDYTFEEKNYTENFNLEKKNDFYKERAIEHVKYVNNSITKSKNEHVISKKFFTFISGGSDSEVFKYASTLWNLYTKDSNINMSYTLDGIIFTPQDQKYTTILRDTKYRIYKWKPPNQNTIDFFVKFEKNKDTGKILNVYDDSNQENISGKVSCNS